MMEIDSHQHTTANDANAMVDDEDAAGGGGGNHSHRSRSSSRHHQHHYMDPHSHAIKQTHSPTSLTQPMDHQKFMQQAAKIHAQQSGLSQTHPVKSNTAASLGASHRVRANSEIASWSQQGVGGAAAGPMHHGGGANAMNGLSVSSAQGLASYSSHHRTSSHPQAAHPTNHKMMSPASHNSSSSSSSSSNGGGAHFHHTRASSGSSSHHSRQRRSPSENTANANVTGGEPQKRKSANLASRHRYARPRPHTLPDTFGADGVFGEPNPAAVSAANNIDNSRGFCMPNKQNQAVLQRLSVHLTETLAACNKQFRYSKDRNPRRILSSPAEKVLNQNYDNKHSDLVLTVNDILTPESPQNATNVKYRVIDLLGKGTFGQVVKCEAVPTGGLVAVKVIKNKPAYYNQALIEIKILKKLNRDFDPKNDHNIVRIVSYFIYKKHLCLVFELLNVNLFDLVKQNRYRGLSCNLIRAFIKQVLKTLIVLKKASIIHCDLKPENILLMNLRTPRVKVIDFGSACFEGHTVYQYIQSRFYRSPEVLCGAEYTCQIDMWSLGCIAAELFLGLPLFPGKDEYHQTRRIIEMRGEFPSYLLAKGSKTQRLFSVNHSPTGEAVFKMKSAQQFCDENDIENTPPKKYFKTHNLHELIMGYQYKADLSEDKKAQEMKTRECFFDFLCGVLNTDPRERWTPAQAYQHPFIRNAEFTGPFDPTKIPLSSLTSPGSGSSRSERYRRRHRSDRHRSSHHRSSDHHHHHQQQASAHHHHHHHSSSSRHHHRRSSRSGSSSTHHHHHQRHAQQQQQQQQQLSQTAPAAPFSPRQRSFSHHDSSNQQPGSNATTGHASPPSLSTSNAMAIDSGAGAVAVGGQQHQQQPPPAFNTQPSASGAASSNLVHRRHAHRSMSHTAPRTSSHHHMATHGSGSGGHHQQHQHRHQTISPPVSAAQQKAHTLARLQRLSIKRSSPSDSDMRAASPTSTSSSGRGTPSSNTNTSSSTSTSNGSGSRSKPQHLTAANANHNNGNPFSDPMPHRSRAFSDDGRPPSGGSGSGSGRARVSSSKGVPMSNASAAALLRQRQMHQASNMSTTMPVFQRKLDTGASSEDVPMLGVSPPGTPRSAAAAAMSMTMPVGASASLSMDLSAPPIGGSNAMRSPRASMDGSGSAAPKSAVHRKFSSSLASTPETSTLEGTPMDRFSDNAVSFNRLQQQARSPTASGPIQQFGFDIKASSSQHLGTLAQSTSASAGPPPPFVSIPGSGIAGSGMGSPTGPASPLSMSRRSSYGMCYAPPPPIGGGGASGAAPGSFSATSTLGSIGSFDMTGSIGSTGSLCAMFNKPGARSPLEFSPPSRDFHKQSQNFFDMNLAELGGVSTGLTPITHGRYVDGGNPSLGTANSAAQTAFYSPQYGTAHHRQQQQVPGQHPSQHRGSFQFYSVTAPAGELANAAVSPRSGSGGNGAVQPPNISLANTLSPQMSATLPGGGGRMRGASISGGHSSPYGFDLASLSAHHAHTAAAAAAAAAHGGHGHHRFNSSGSMSGGGSGSAAMQLSTAPGSGMNSPRAAFGGSGMNSPSGQQQPE